MSTLNPKSCHIVINVVLDGLITREQAVGDKQLIVWDLISWVLSMLLGRHDSACG